MTIPHETSTAGVPAYRIADVLGKERTDHNYFGLNWLSNNFEPFVFKNNVSNAVKLPIDTHALIAMMAPRGLLVLENPHQAQMGAPAGHTATVAGAAVYKALGVEKNVSYHSKVAETAHCSYKNEYTDLLVEDIATFLKHEGDAPGEFVVGSDGSLSMADWVDWQAQRWNDGAVRRARGPDRADGAEARSGLSDTASVHLNSPTTCPGRRPAPQTRESDGFRGLEPARSWRGMAHRSAPVL